MFVLTIRKVWYHFRVWAWVGRGFMAVFDGRVLGREIGMEGLGSGLLESGGVSFAGRGASAGKGGEPARVGWIYRKPSIPPAEKLRDGSGRHKQQGYSFSRPASSNANLPPPLFLIILLPWAGGRRGRGEENGGGPASVV